MTQGQLTNAQRVRLNPGPASLGLGCVSQGPGQRLGRAAATAIAAIARLSSGSAPCRPSEGARWPQEPQVRPCPHCDLLHPSSEPRLGSLLSPSSPNTGDFACPPLIMLLGTASHVPCPSIEWPSPPHRRKQFVDAAQCEKVLWLPK